MRGSSFEKNSEIYFYLFLYLKICFHSVLTNFQLCKLFVGLFEVQTSLNFANLDKSWRNLKKKSSLNKERLVNYLKKLNFSHWTKFKVKKNLFMHVSFKSTLKGENTLSSVTYDIQCTFTSWTWIFKSSNLRKLLILQLV